MQRKDGSLDVVLGRAAFADSYAPAQAIGDEFPGMSYQFAKYFVDHVSLLSYKLTPEHVAELGPEPSTGENTCRFLVHIPLKLSSDVPVPCFCLAHARTIH